MDNTLLEISLAVWLCLVGPIVYYLLDVRGRKKQAEGNPVPLMTDYITTTIFLWASVFVFFVTYYFAGRDLQTIGLGSEPGLVHMPLFSTGIPMSEWIVVAIAALFMILQLKSLDNEDVATKYREAYKNTPGVYDMVPKTRSEFRMFLFVGFTAGITEEILYRGFLIVFLTPYVGFWGAAALSLAAFAASHAYQRDFGAILKVILMGAVFTLMVTSTGTLWAAIVLHIIVDVVAGFATYKLLRKD